MEKRRFPVGYSKEEIAMKRIRFTLSIVKEAPESVEESPCCGSGVVIHQRTVRGLDDTRIGEVLVIRYRCKECGWKGGR